MQKRVVGSIVICFVLLVGFVSGIYFPEDCSEAEMKKAWNEFFVDDVSSLDVYVNGNSNYDSECIALSLGENARVLRGWIQENQKDIVKELWGYNFNLSSEGDSHIGSVNSYSDWELLLEDFEDGKYIENRSNLVDSEFEAKQVAESVFEVLLDNISLDTGGFGWSDERFFYGKGILYVDILKNIGHDHLRKLEVIFKTLKLKKLKDFDLDENEGWENYGDLDSYVVKDDVGEFWFGYSVYDSDKKVWKNGSKGIDVGINSDNFLKFRPKVDYVGKEIFRIHVYAGNKSSENVVLENVSNNFSVSVAKNEKPVFDEAYAELILNNNENYTFDLYEIFEDDDSELGFKINYSGYFSAKLNKGKLKVFPQKDVVGNGSMYLTANDEEYEIESGKIVVVVKNPDEDYEGVNNNSNDEEEEKFEIKNFSEVEKKNFTKGENLEFFVEVEGENVTYEWFVNNESVNKTENKVNFSDLGVGEYEVRVDVTKDGEKLSKKWDVVVEESNINWLFWGLIGIIVGCVLLLIGFLLFYIINMQRKKKINVEERESSEKTQEYLQQLNENDEQVGENEEKSNKKVENKEGEKMENKKVENNEIKSEKIGDFENNVEKNKKNVENGVEERGEMVKDRAGGDNKKVDEGIYK